MTPLDYLFGLELHGIKLGLDNITQLLREAGDPQRTYPSVHIGGTNGKGSVVALLDAILRAAGYRTGRFTSPHLCDVRERFLADGNMIDADELDSAIDLFRSFADRMESPPTFFEFNTAIAFQFFAQRKVDLALVEVGMGGRFDSTNVLLPEACAITNVSLEHTAYLGDTVEKIAFEKAGIIKEGVPVIVAEQNPRPREVILEQARKLNSPASILNDDFQFELEGGPFSQRLRYRGKRFSFEDAPLGLSGSYQGANAAVAVALAESLSARFPKLTEATVREGLARAEWPCRLERVLDDPPVVVDVAHNRAGALELARAMDRPCIVLLALSSDKDARAILQALDPISDKLILTQFAGSRALPVEQLCAAASGRTFDRADSIAEALDLGMRLASTERPLLVAGSVFTAGEARRILVERHGAKPLPF